MTASTTTRSAYPRAVVDLIPHARALAADLGTVPSRNLLKRTFKIGPDKAKLLLAELTTAPAVPPALPTDPESAPAAEQLADQVEPIEDLVEDLPEPAELVEPEAVAVATDNALPAPITPERLAELDKIARRADTPALTPVVALVPDPPVTAPPVAVGTPPVGVPAGAQVAQFKRRRWAVRAVLALGVAASIAGNVLHAQDNVISQVISAWSPTALLLTIELISRVPVYARYLAVARFAATGVIAAIAAWVSYGHMAAVAARYGESGSAAYLLPLSVDGLVVVASVCLVELSGRINAARP